MSFIVDKLKDKVNFVIDRRAIAGLNARVKLVLRQRELLKVWNDNDLRGMTAAFKSELQRGESLDNLLVPGFAVVSETARRLFGKILYPAQVLAGAIIHQGKVAEMKAGEGKTLMETMPVYLNALTGQGVHIVTTNDYLAERDAKDMGRLYNFLGLTVGYITSDMESDARRQAYGCDITYVANQEVGFDYLRDHLVFRRADRVLRPQHALHFGIVDEIDSILIDESRTPLIIAEPVAEQRENYGLFTRVVNGMVESEDYLVDYVHKNVSLTNRGLDKAEKLLGSSVFSQDNPMYVFYLDVCLKAKVLFERDRDYIVTDEGVEIVDEFTGRVLPGRRFTDGVHQAIEAKEQVPIKDSDQTQASITFQNFFPKYEKLSGMSGTVMRARDEFNQIYKLDVVKIPTHLPVIRQDLNDLFFKTQKGKLQSLVKRAREINDRGQPLLVGTRNVETAHLVATLLGYENLTYQLLTAADHRAEAEKIAKAGQAGMITIATNMAGRGTDILLGPAVAEKGGLFVLGTERHESRRIDDQLIGRSGRQGSPGQSQFLISMEDEIMQLFGSEKIIDMMEGYDILEDEYVSGKNFDAAFQRAQNFVESRNYDSRIYLYKYDGVINLQREFIYQLRESLLENPGQFLTFLQKAVAELAEEIFAFADAKRMAESFRQIFFIDAPETQLSEALSRAASGGQEKKSLATLKNYFLDYLTNRALRIQQDDKIFGVAQNMILKVVDSQWSSQLELMESLKEEASLLSYASEDPLVDYILEGEKLFANMLMEIKKQLLRAVFWHFSQQDL